MPDVDDERAEVINYGLQILIGEVPKFFIMLFIAYALGLLKLSLITFLIIMPYRMFSGGFHLHTHIGCIITTTTFYCGVAFLSKSIMLNDITKYELIKSFDEVLSLDLLKENTKLNQDNDMDEYILAKIEERNNAKKEKNYALADQIRDELANKGIILKDSREGTTYEIVK